MTGVQIRRSEGSLPTWHQLPEPAQGNCLCYFESRVVVLGFHGCWGWGWGHSRWVSLAQGKEGQSLELGLASRPSPGLWPAHCILNKHNQTPPVTEPGDGSQGSVAPPLGKTCHCLPADWWAFTILHSHPSHANCVLRLSRPQHNEIF